jgi:hypothetical protein
MLDRRVATAGRDIYAAGISSPVTIAAKAAPLRSGSRFAPRELGRTQRLRSVSRERREEIEIGGTIVSDKEPNKVLVETFQTLRRGNPQATEAELRELFFQAIKSNEYLYKLLCWDVFDALADKLHDEAVCESCSIPDFLRKPS